VIDGKKDDEEKKSGNLKQPQIIGNVIVVDLSDCKVDDHQLMSDSNKSGDKEGLDPTGYIDGSGVGVTVGAETPIPEVALVVVVEDAALVVVAEDVALAATCVGSRSNPSMDPLFNATGKAPPVDAVVVKQEAGWF
jgi:hypothetical protein